LYLFFMALLLQQIQDIDTLQEINNLSMEVIQHRARKISDNTTDPEWRYRSFDGFIGEDETFKDRLKKDWCMVQSIGCTHVQLAACLKKIIVDTEMIREREQYGLMRTINLAFNASGLLPCCSCTTQSLTIFRHCFNGFQFSLFFNPLLESSPLNGKWKEEYTVENVHNGLQIRVAGNTHAGVIQYIESFGFYEGDESNPYRVNPHILFSVLTGIMDKQAIASALLEKESSLLLKLEKELSQLKMEQQEYVSSKEQVDLNALFQYQEKAMMDAIALQQQKISSLK